MYSKMSWCRVEFHIMSIVTEYIFTVFQENWGNTNDMKSWVASQAWTSCGPYDSHPRHILRNVDFMDMTWTSWHGQLFKAWKVIYNTCQFWSVQLNKLSIFHQTKKTIYSILNILHLTWDSMNLQPHRLEIMNLDIVTICSKMSSPLHHTSVFCFEKCK